MDNRINIVLRVIGYFLISMSIFLFVLHIVGANGMKNAKDLTQLTAADIKTGLFVKGDIVESGGIYASKEITVDGMVTDSWNYYVISFGENYDRYMGFFTMLVQDEMEKLTEETAAYYDGQSSQISTTVPMTGLVLPIAGQFNTYYHIFMEPVPQEMYVDYYITHIDSAMIQRLLIFGCVVLPIGMILAVIAVFGEKKLLGEEYDEKKKQRFVIKTIMFWAEMLVTFVMAIVAFF